MSNPYKALLREQLEKEETLIECIKECFKEIFGEHSDRAFFIFENEYEDESYGSPGFTYIKKKLNDELKFIREAKELVQQRERLKLCESEIRSSFDEQANTSS